MEIADKGFKNGFICAFQFAIEMVSYYLHVSLLEICKSYELCTFDLSISKKHFIEFEMKNFKVFWKETLIQPKKDLLEDLCIKIYQRTSKGGFWAKVRHYLFIFLIGIHSMQG